MTSGIRRCHSTGSAERPIEGDVRMAQSHSLKGESGLKGLDKEAQGFLRGGQGVRILV